MSQGNNVPKLHVTLSPDKERPHIILERGQLASMKIKLSEARQIADKLHDIMDSEDETTLDET